jgi:hypothetical protein
MQFVRQQMDAGGDLAGAVGEVADAGGHLAR